jgi:SAM-dependent methyltransferase
MLFLYAADAKPVHSGFCDRYDKFTGCDLTKLTELTELTDFGQGPGMISSISEQNGIDRLRPQDLKIYSVGISTAGSAEIRMAEEHPNRQVVATTLDRHGAVLAKKEVAARGLEKQIEVKIEDVARPLPYPDGYFDFIYARLVLHYLDRARLVNALSELQRVLGRRGQLFVLVRSDACQEANSAEATLDQDTGLTSCISPSSGERYQRYFHSEESIRTYLVEAGFEIASCRSYEEQLCVDFHRLQPSNQIDTLIEVCATKTSNVIPG